MNQFANVCFLVKHLQSAIIPNYDIQDSIIIIIAINSLYNNFKTIINRIFESKNKSIDEIQQILAFVEAKFLNKRTIRVTRDFAMMF